MKFAPPVLLYEIEKTAIATADVKQVITVFYELQENFACYVFVQNGKAVLPILPCVEFYHCYRADFLLWRNKRGVRHFSQSTSNVETVHRS